MASNTKIVCDCGCEMLKKSHKRHLLTNKHNELMKLKNANKNIKPLEVYYKDNLQDVKPIIAKPVNTILAVNIKEFKNEKIKNAPIEIKTVEKEPIIVIPKKFTKSDYIDMLLYHLNKDNDNPNKRVTLTNLSKAKIDKIKELMIKYGITDEKQTYYDMMKKNIMEEEKEKREIEESKRKLYEEIRLREIQDLKLKEEYDKLPDYVKNICEKKFKYEKYYDDLKVKSKIIKQKNKVMCSFKDSISPLFDLINFNGVSIDFMDLGLNKVIYNEIYLNNFIKDIIKDYKKYNEMGLEYI